MSSETGARDGPGGPATTPAGRRADERPADGRVDERAPARVLVTDDNRLSQRTLARGVELQGHTALTAGDGVEALEVLRREQVDAVLLDIVMPELDGFGVLEAMQADHDLRDIPVIVISAVDDMDSVVRAIEMGAVDYLPKPFNPVLLAARLRTSLQRKRLNDLRRAYLEQEVMLRQSEKLATLGRLSAGMAHELNNPASAAARAARHLGAAIERLEASTTALAAQGVGDDDLRWLRERSAGGDRLAPLDPLARSDLTDELEGWLGARGVAEPWQLAPALADGGLDPAGLEPLGERFSGPALAAVLRWLADRRVVVALVEQVAEPTARVARLVSAMKGYTYLDQAPVQDVDVRQALDDTLALLGPRLAQATVVRDYDPGVPRVVAHGSELNQAWTNLIDNALDALEARGGRGTLTLRARPAEGGVAVEVEDDGPGIPEDLQPCVFDPFMTTKPPGHGTGLGLNVTHQIVVQRHGGRVELESRPGMTRFTVWLPPRPAAPAEHNPG